MKAKMLAALAAIAMLGAVGTAVALDSASVPESTAYDQISDMED